MGARTVAALDEAIRWEARRLRMAEAVVQARCPGERVCAICRASGLPGAGFRHADDCAWVRLSTLLDLRDHATGGD